MFRLMRGRPSPLHLCCLGSGPAPTPTCKTNIITNLPTNTINLATNTINLATNAINLATNTINLATNTINLLTNTINLATLFIASYPERDFSSFIFKIISRLRFVLRLIWIKLDYTPFGPNVSSPAGFFFTESLDTEVDSETHSLGCRPEPLLKTRSWTGARTQKRSHTWSSPQKGLRLGFLLQKVLLQSRTWPHTCHQVAELHLYSVSIFIHGKRRFFG